MSLLDIVPTVPRDPFARGALLPTTIETQNSTYTIRFHARRVDEPAMCTVSCTRGTFADHSWFVPVSAVLLTRCGLYVGAGVGLQTTRPTKVDGHIV